MSGTPEGSQLLNLADVTDVPELQLDELPDDPLDTVLIGEHADAAVDEDLDQDADL